MKKKLIILSLLFLVAFLFYWTNRHNFIKKHLKGEIEIYSILNKDLSDNLYLAELKSKCEIITNPKQIIWTDNQIDFIINPADKNCLRNDYPIIYKLFEEYKILSIVFYKNGTVNFIQKRCGRSNCENHVGGFSGYYYHCLTNGKIPTSESDYTKIYLENKYKEWNYYTVWYKKG